MIHESVVLNQTLMDLDYVPLPLAHDLILSLFCWWITCGRWIISHNRRYLWGKYFYWICDCNTIIEVLEYTRSIHQIRRWSQKIFAYDLSIIHRPAKMMKDIDACSRSINTLIYWHLVYAYSIRCRNIISRPYAKSHNVSHHCSNLRHISVPSTTSITTSSSVTFRSTLHHFSLCFLQSQSLFHLST